MRTGTEGLRQRIRFAGRACVAIGVGSAVFQGLCALGQGLTRRSTRIDVTSVGVPVIAGVLLLAAAPWAPDGGRSRGSQGVDAGAASEIKHAETSTDIAYSIVIPVYNRPRDVVDLLERISTFSEKWKPLGRGEIIVVDDGSTDNTADVARDCARQSPMETRVITQRNAGSSVARNTGFAHARGAIGVSIDSDCLPYEDWLPNLLRHVRPDAAVVAFGAVRSDRRARMPLEVSPAGAEFVTASFAMPIDVFCRLGGFFAGFNGQFRDDTDFVLSVRRAGVATVQANDALVWHPIRRLATLKSVWRTGLAHRFDTLLAARHGEAALPFASNLLLGGSWWGNFPTSCVFLGGAWVSIAGSLLKLAGIPSVSPRAQGLGWVTIGAGLLSLGSFGAAYHRVPLAEVPRYIASVITYVAAASAGRLIGLVKYRIALL